MANLDVICFSHLRWNSIFQRPQHLMSRFAREHRVFFFEEPTNQTDIPQVSRISDRLWRVVPRVRTDCKPGEVDEEIQAQLLSVYLEHGIEKPIFWFYTPMLERAVRSFERARTVYDCMDELSNFLHAPPDLRARERELMERSDVMFTGGMALYESKRKAHHNVHGVPSSVDVAFFAKARAHSMDPVDQAGIPRPRVGYYGAIDEQIDLELLAAIADLRPKVHFVMLGPVVKIAPDSLPRRPNLHYLGYKDYADLPSYVAGWTVAMMPFALNAATRYISPTKTPEFLAAGKPVVSTAIQDVVEPYGRLGLVRIAREPNEFVEGIQASLDGIEQTGAEERDAFLAHTSWDQTFSRMRALVMAPRKGRGSATIHHDAAHFSRDASGGRQHV